MYRHLRDTQQRHWNVTNAITQALHSILKNIRGNITKSLKKYAHYATRVLSSEWNYGAISNIAIGAIAPNIKSKWISMTTTYYIKPLSKSTETYP